MSTMRTSLVVTSLGFHAEPTNALYDPAQGHLRAVANRVVSHDGTVLRNVYASGWAATGARGVLASTMMNANDVASTIVADMEPSSSSAARSANREAMNFGLNPDPQMEEVPEEVRRGVEQGVVTDYEDWNKVNREEIRRGEISGKERERMTWEDAASFLRRSTIPSVADESTLRLDWRARQGAHRPGRKT
jgi:adrenodoxin-NADP+ reductase